jgi:putative SOS response-associated peptidase YedK
MIVQTSAEDTAASPLLCLSAPPSPDHTPEPRYHGLVCGRYVLTVTGRVLARLFDLDEVPELEARYNIAPTQQVPIVRAGPDGRRLDAVRWGLIPSWAKDPSIGSRMINARAETVAEKPSFRNAFRRRRCLVPADGFYEWRRNGNRKQPYLVRFGDGRPFAIAGLWEVWHRPDGTPLESCTLITTEPNLVVALLHDRMPVILPQRSYRDWLEPANEDPERLRRLLLPHDPDEMEAFPVSLRVNNPSHDDPMCLQATAEP